MFSVDNTRSKENIYAADFLATSVKTSQPSKRLARSQRGCPVPLCCSVARATGATKVNLRNGVFKIRGSVVRPRENDRNFPRCGLRVVNLSTTTIDEIVSRFTKAERVQRSSQIFVLGHAAVDLGYGPLRE